MIDIARLFFTKVVTMAAAMVTPFTPHLLTSVLLLLLLLLLLFSKASSGCNCVPSEENVSSCGSILTELRHHCGLREVVVISGEERESRGYHGLPHTLVNCISAMGIPFFHYVISNYTTIDDVTTIVKRHSSQQHLRHTTFVIVSPRFDDVLYAAQLYSKRALRTSGLLWLHSTRWLVISPATTSPPECISQPRGNTPMDNVAFVSLRQPASPNNDPQSWQQAEIYTLVWRPGRTRQFERVAVNSGARSTTKSCFLFPNLSNGLNGRRLTVITKSNWGFFVFVGKNSLSGHLEYKGFTIDVLDTMASALNFSYRLVPTPDPSHQASWDEIAHNVTTGLADLSATFWSYSWHDVYNISVTYPVLLDSFTGVYRQRKPSQEYMSLYILCPFNGLTYVLLLASLVYTVLIYLFIVGLVYRNENTTRPRDIFTAEKRRARPAENNHHVQRGARQRGRILSLWNVFATINSVSSSLVASILNQAYLPSPLQMSARLLLFLWSLAMVMFYAIYTGSLTAQMVDTSDPYPIRSFENLVARRDYGWGSTGGSIIDTVMAKASSGLLYDLNRAKRNVPEDTYADIYPLLKRQIQTLDHGFVFIHFKSLMKQIVGTMDNPSDYFLIKDSLLSANQGFLTSKDSELSVLFSQTIRQMQDTGVVEKLYRNYVRGNMTAVEEDHRGTNRKKDPLTLHDIQWPLIILVFLVVVSTVVLVVERLWSSAVLVFRHWKSDDDDDNDKDSNL